MVNFPSPNNQGDQLLSLPNTVKWLVTLFLVTLSAGFYTGIRFVHFTTAGGPVGIVENYNGNEDNEDALEMKFKKSEHEMLNIIHTHLLSMSVIFLIMGLLVASFYPTSNKWISAIIIEPMLSALITF
ncbi:MAG: hypothetical protein AAFQ02_05400, partial [Bacteroidota bacterium]